MDSSTDLPILFRSKLARQDKWNIAKDYIRISIKLFTIHRIFPIKKEKALGFRISFFDYGAFHFLFREIFLKNEYYFDTPKKNPLIIDCGANIGMSVLYFKWLYPRATVYAFEPDPETFKILEENVQQNNLKNVHIYNLALAGKTGQIDFYIDQEHPGWLTMSTIKERLPKDKISVPAGKLSRYIKNASVDMLKIDTEGAEPEIIADLAKNKRLQKIKRMAIEYHHQPSRSQLPQFLDILQKNNFSCQFSAQLLPGQKLGFEDINIYAENLAKKQL